MSDEKIVTQIMAVAKAMNCQFMLRGDEIAIDKVFSATGLLPAIMRRADQLCSFCLGHGLGVTFERSDGAMLGVSVIFDSNVAASLRLLCVADVLVEIVQGAPSPEKVALDMLMEEQ